MTSTLSQQDKFKDNTLYLSQYCGTIIKKAFQEGLTTISPTWINLGLSLVQGYDSTELIENFIEYSYSFWDQINKRNETFFDKNIDTVFNTYSKETVSLFRLLFDTKRPDGTPLITDVERTEVWNTFQSLVRISIRYIHEKRGPKKQTDGSFIYLNNNEYNQVTDLSRLIDDWKIRSKLT